MKILHYMNQFSPTSQTFIYDLITGLEKRECTENYILTHKRLLENERPANNLTVVPRKKQNLLKRVCYRIIKGKQAGNFFKKVPKKPGAFDNLIPHIVSIRPDIIHSHFSYNGVNINRILNARQTDYPQIISCHGYDILTAPAQNPFYRTCLLKTGEQNNVYFTASSLFLKNKMIEFGLPAEKIALIPCYPHAKFFKSKRKAPFKKGDIFSILNVARLERVKGQTFLLKAFKRVLNNYSNARLTLVGSGSLEATLKKEAIFLGIENKTTFIGSAVHEKVPEILCAHDVFIQPSIIDDYGAAENSPVATREALAAGCPVIASNIGGIPEIFKEGTGYLVEKKNSDQLAEKIIYLIDNEKEMACLGENAKRYALQNFSQEDQIDALIKLYKKRLNEFKIS